MAKKNKGGKSTLSEAKKNGPDKKRKAQDSSSQDMASWVASLAKQAHDVDASSSRDAVEVSASSKQERIQRRTEKKLRRQEEKSLRSQKIEDKRRHSAQSQQQHAPVPNNRRCHNLDDNPNNGNNSTQQQQQQELRKLSQALATCLARFHGKRPFLPDSNSSKAQHRKRDWQSADRMQPRRRDYGGQGLARPTLFLPFDSPAWRPQLEEEFAQHVPGFYGRTRSKAAKRQADSNMLWRQMLAEKKTTSKKSKMMTADERVESLLRAGKL